ncbi:MAG: reverse transcriptase domain-containing protein [Actinomycetota bacterium]
MLERAWREVRANRGAAGVDAQTIDEIEKSGAEAFLDELHRELREQRYRPLPVRRVMIPKPQGGERALGVPAVRDRVVQTAAVIVLSPIFEADFLDCSFGFRRARSAHQALERVSHEVNKGRTWVVDADIRSFFDSIIAQFDGYQDLEELDWDDCRQRYGNIGRLDLILEAENDTPNRYQAPSRPLSLSLSLVPFHSCLFSPPYAGSGWSARSGCEDERP